MNPFAGSGEKQLMIMDITSVEYRTAEKHQPGYIQFTFHGGQESKAVGGNVYSDENTVMFGQKQSPQFDSLRQAIESKMLTYRLRQGSSATTPASSADELTKLADLLDRNVITKQEFEQQKRRLLGS